MKTKLSVGIMITAKGVNIVSAIYYCNGYRIPVMFDLVRKTKTVFDEKTKKEKLRR